MAPSKNLNELEQGGKIEKEEVQIKTSKEKSKMIGIFVLKFLGLLVFLYFFIVSLDLMSNGFRVLGGKEVSQFLSSPYVLENPVTGLMIGVLVTVVVQSSSTSTSIVVSMVGSEIMTIKQAIPVIMGANIGTSVTSTIVSLGQVNDKENFRRAFAGATIHDCFNLLSVLIFLPLEVATGYLRKVTNEIVNGSIGDKNSTNVKEPPSLTYFTKPLTKLVIQLNSTVLNEAAAHNGNETFDKSLLKHNCKSGSCGYAFEYAEIPEWAVGLIVVVLALVLLSSCLIGMVKILSSIFQGHVAKIVEKIMNSEPDNCFKYFTGYLAMIFGCLLTILVQSSSVFTSSIVPMVGLGMVSLERVLPMVLGANIGTTFTGILAALSVPSNLKISLQIALCHTLFNLSAILVWYPIPFLRQAPIKMAQFLGNMSAEYRWFSIFYMILVFIIIPIIVFGLSIAGIVAFSIVLSLILLLILLIIALNLLQKYVPHRVPEKLRTWEFLPLPMRSLQPYDKILMKIKCCKSKIADTEIQLEDVAEADMNKKVPVNSPKIEMRF